MFLTNMNEQMQSKSDKYKIINFNVHLFFCLFICLLFPPFIYFTSHLYCITRFEDEDAICIIKYQVTRINGEGRI